MFPTPNYLNFLIWNHKTHSKSKYCFSQPPSFEDGCAKRVSRCQFHIFNVMNSAAGEPYNTCRVPYCYSCCPGLYSMVYQWVWECGVLDVGVLTQSLCVCASRKQGAQNRKQESKKAGKPTPVEQTSMLQMMSCA